MNDELIQGVNEEVLNALGALLNLSDEEFSLMAPQVLETYQNELAKTSNKNELATAMKDHHITHETLQESLGELRELIDKEMAEFSQIKREFMYQFFVTAYNAMDEVIGMDNVIRIPIELCNPNAKIPTYAHDGDAGMDVYSTIDATIKPGETVLIPLGFKVAIPKGYELQVRPRSGFSLKTNLRVANAPGTIDSGYRDEVGVILTNIASPIKEINEDLNPKSVLWGEGYTISKGDRIAQLVLQKVPTAAFIETSDISLIGENRGGGYGSTGVN